MEHTRFVGLDIHKERISIAVAESGRSGAVEYLGEISNDPDAIGKLCDRLRRPGKTLAFFATKLARGRRAQQFCHLKTRAVILVHQRSLGTCRRQRRVRRAPQGPSIVRKINDDRLRGASHHNPSEWLRIR